MKRKKWTDEMVISEAREIALRLGHFPSVSHLRSIGRNDLSVQITRRGGFLRVASEVGIGREWSDSDTGWLGEREVQSRLSELGHECDAPSGLRSPFDILVDGRVRVDVKSAKYHEYGACRGWFYRIGKHVQADIVILHELDTKNDYVFFWWEVTASNMTLTVGGGKYKSALNAHWKVTEMKKALGALLGHCC